MITLDAHLTALSSPDLLAALERTAAHGREVTADLIALLAECDTRQLYATEGYPSLFEFCVAHLRLSESQAYHRIQAARAVQRFPLVLERLREGRVSLTAVALLREHLTDANHREVLDWADGRRKREVEEFVRRLDPRPDAAPSLRRLAPSPPPGPLAVAADHSGSARAGEAASGMAQPLVAAPAAPPARPAAGSVALLPPAAAVGTLVAPPALLSGAAALGEPRGFRAEMRPTAPARYNLRVTISEETADKLRRVQALLGHALPSADPAAVLDRALTLLLAQLERRKAGAPAKPKRVATETRPKALTSPHTGAASPAPAVAPQTCAGKPAPGTSKGGATANAAPQRQRRTGAADRACPRSRYIPAAVRRAVWDRDQGRCAYVSASGTRCTATGALEFHHRVPFAEGGASTVENVALACKRHNAVEAERWFNFDWTEFGAGESRSRGA